MRTHYPKPTNVTKGIGMLLAAMVLAFMSTKAQSNVSGNSIPNQYESTNSPAPGAKAGSPSAPGQYESASSVINGNKPAQSPSQYDAVRGTTPGAKAVGTGTSAAPGSAIGNANVAQKTQYFEDQAKRQGTPPQQINHSTAPMTPQPKVYNAVNQYEQKAGLPSSWDKPAAKTSAPGSAVQQPSSTVAPANAASGSGTYQTLPMAPGTSTAPSTNSPYQTLEKVPAPATTSKTATTGATTTTTANSAQSKAGATSTSTSKSGAANSSGRPTTTPTPKPAKGPSAPLRK